MMPDVATRETARFVREWAKRWPAPRILEIGCGEGEVAAVLQAEGARVVAIDRSDDVVQAARARGVDARLGTWPDFAGGPFDVVAFTRSLHHIATLDRAVERAHALLDVGGVLLAEEFAFDAFDERTSSWFGEVLRDLDAAGVAFALDSFCSEMLKSERGLEAWLADHGHELHTAEAMKQALERVFGSVTVEETPYLYRFVRGALVDETQRARVEEVWRSESVVGRKLPNFYIGRRFVAEKR